MDAGVPETDQDTGQELPPSVSQTVVEIIQQYGWFIILGAVAAYFLWKKLQPKLQRFQYDHEERDLKKYDSNTAQKRLEAMERARQRLQDQYSSQTQTYAEEQKKKEEQKRQERIEDWDRHLEGKGYRNKYRPSEETPSTSKPKPTKKTPIRPADYNPLMGAGGGSYRPPARRTGGG